eukprot:11468684-Alexandrium_andersonii.AAC.1
MTDSCPLGWRASRGRSRRRGRCPRLVRLQALLGLPRLHRLARALHRGGRQLAPLRLPSTRSARRRRSRSS